LTQITKPTSRKSSGKGPLRRGSSSAIRALARPDEWAISMGLKVDGKPFTLEGGEYIQQVIRDTSPEIVIPKAAQTRFTVTFLTRSLHWITQRGWHHLYLLPLKTGAIPFVQARIDPIIDSNPILGDQFQSVDNRLHKQSRQSINLYIRGTNIKSELQEIPVDVEVWDERDRMIERLPDDTDPLEEARHRMDGSKIRKLTMLSTPTVEGYGVYADEAWGNSDQHRWEIKCPSCGRFQVLNFEDNLKLGNTYLDCALQCIHCPHVFSDEERITLNATGRWVPYNPDGNIRGYHISQFNSPTQPLSEIMKAWYAGQNEILKLKSFYNQNLGLPYTAPGDKLTPQVLDKCVEPGYTLGGIPNGSVYVGIDIGTLIHVISLHYDRYNRSALWDLRLFREFDQVEKYLDGLISFSAVIDAHPEKRAARDLAIKFHGKLWIGFSDDRDQNEQIAAFNVLKVGEAGKVRIDRNLALDQVSDDFIRGRAILPADARELGEPMPKKQYNGLYHQFNQMVRIEQTNTKGVPVVRWVKNRNPDHWHHAWMFARVAMEKAPTLLVPPAISSAMSRFHG
jgi:hypothetical protein